MLDVFGGKQKLKKKMCWMEQNRVGFHPTSNKISDIYTLDEMLDRFNSALSSVVRSVA